MNRRSWLLIKIVILVVIAISLSNLFLRLLLNEDGWINIGLGNRHVGDDTGGVDVQETEYSDINYVDIRLVNIPLEIREAPVDQVKLIDTTEASSLFKKYHPIRVKQKGNTLEIEQKNKFFLLGLFSNKTRGEVVLEIPQGQKITYDIETVSGDIVLNAQSVGELEIESVSANIEVYHAGDELTVESISGNIEVHESFLYIDGETVSGNMKYVANEISREISVDTISGDTMILLEYINDYNLEYSTVSGEILDSGKSTNNSKNPQKSTSGVNIKFDSVSGNLSLKAVEK